MDDKEERYYVDSYACGTMCYAIMDRETHTWYRGRYGMMLWERHEYDSAQEYCDKLNRGEIEDN